MKKLITGVLVLIMCIAFSACTRGQTTKQADEYFKVTISVGEQDFTATLYKSSTSEEFIKLLPLKAEMNELNGNEKYFYLEKTLPAAPVSVGKIEKGDFMLFGNNCLVLFYESFQTPYTYTRLGRADDPDGLSAALKSHENKVTVNFSVTA